MRYLLTLQTLWLAFGISLSAQAENNIALSHLHKSQATILREEIKQHAEVLADDTMEGREAGSAGGRSAATYIMRAVSEAGLQPAGLNGTFYQPFRAGCRNILAEVPAADSSNGDIEKEAIIVCAHYDHVGYGTRKTSHGPTGFIHNGADDNASGVATILEVAQALQQYEGKLKRRVLFIFWDAEEKGLWGSKHWLKHPTMSLNDVKLMINVDMVGRLRDKLSLYGTRSLPGLRYAWSKSNRDGAVSLDFPWETVNNSDHYPFFQTGIPITMVHTGLHDDYHTPSDDAYRLNYDGIEATSKLLLDFVVQMANRDAYSDFRWKALQEKERQQQAFERLPLDASRKLGITLGKLHSGMRIKSVVVGSRADKFGLRPGDKILSLDGETPKSFVSFRNHVATAAESVTLLVESKRDEPREVTISFDQQPPRLGLSWLTSEPEPNTIVVSRVLRDSVADRAGLRRLDRIHKINGEQIDDGDGFRRRIGELEEEAELLVERDGKLRIVTVEFSDQG